MDDGLAVEEHAFCHNIAQGIVQVAKDREFQAAIFCSENQIRLAHGYPKHKPTTDEDRAKVRLMSIRHFVEWRLKYGPA